MMPPDPRISQEWMDIAAQARSQPGVWMLARRDVWKATAHQINKGLIAAFADGTFRAVCRSRPDRENKSTTDVWIVHIPA
jgi:hypothetical protein